ncbi:MAG TPA: hypothetical protein VJ793_20380 [Anaerolineae bacterium]|nr:hypothetical protein [Anaerolineae bacterium]
MSRPLNFTQGGTALTTLAYNPDAADHLVNGNSMVAQFVSQILPPQAIAAQQIGWGTEMLEVAASNNLFPMLRLYGVNVAGTTNLGTILAGTRQATELGTSLTGQAYVQAGSAVTFNEPWRLVAEWGVGGLPVNTATDTHNASIVFGDPLATGPMTLIQNQDTGNAPAVIVFSADIITSFGGPVAAYGMGI